MMARKKCIEPWQRRPGESEEAHAAFVIYRDLGSERSIDRVKQVWGEGRANSDALLFRWSARHAWVERCREWDNHLQRERDRELGRRAAKWQARRLDALELDYAMANRMRDLAVEILRSVVATSATTRDAAMLAKLGSELAAAAIAAALGPKAEAQPGEGPEDANSGMRPEVAEAALRAIAEASGVSLDDD